MDEDTVSWQLVKLAKAHRALVSEALAEIGLHLGQDLLLGELWEQDGLPQSELIARLHVEPPTMTKMLQRMERAGLLRRERAPAGGRVWRVYLTEHGRALEHPVRAIRAEVEQRLLRGLSQQERASLRPLLARMTRNLLDARAPASLRDAGAATDPRDAGASRAPARAPLY
jgi:MarR family transcriptional regulator, organic hydroperoxide resistance regulator